MMIRPGSLMVPPTPQGALWPNVNLLTNPNDLNGSSWTKINGSITSTTESDPDGGTDAHVFTSTGGYVQQVFNAVIGAQYRLTGFIKAVGTDATDIDIALQDNGSPFGNIVILGNQAPTAAEGWVAIDETVTKSSGIEATRFRVQAASGDVISLWNLDLRRIA
jgi:hypothetical protein